MSLEGPNSENSLTVIVTLENGARVFTPQQPEPANLAWNVDHRRLDIKQPGRYFLTMVAAGFTFDSTPVAFEGSHHGFSVYQKSASQVSILIATDAGPGDRTHFWLVGTDSDGRPTIIDPTILVEPPGGTPDVVPPSIAAGTLLVSVAMDENSQLVYKEELVDTPHLEWDQEALSAKVSHHGTYFLVYGTDFELGTPAVEFPGGQPDFIKLTETGHLAILEIRVRIGQPKESVPVKLNAAADAFPSNNEPTILVEPPGQID